MTTGCPGRLGVSDAVENADRQAVSPLFQFSMRISRELRVFLCIFDQCMQAEARLRSFHMVSYFISPHT